MTQGVKSHTTKIGIGDGQSPEQFTNVDECYKVGEFGGTKSLIDFSNHDSVNLKEYQVADLAEGDEVSCEANWIPGNTSQGNIQTAYNNSTQDNYKITMRDGTTYVFPGVCTQAKRDPSALDGRVVFKFNVKVAGNIVETPAA